MSYPCECGGTVKAQSGRGSGYYAACNRCYRIVTVEQLLREAAPTARRRLKARKSPEESDRERIEAAGYPEGVDYEALILAEQDDP